MKYWRGYLVAAIIGACSWGLIEFAQSHWKLVDMIYPYMVRMIQDYLTNWSSGVSFCLWQLILIVLGVVVLASAVMMILWKWNPIQWFGWITAAASILFFLNTAIWGLSSYAGPLSEDIRLDVSDYTVSQLQTAAEFYQAKANGLALQIPRDGDNLPKVADIETLSQQAAEGFESQLYDHYNAVFSGSTVPVKTLGWSDMMSARGITGITVGITGEAAVNPNTPPMAMPFVVCRQMAQRMCITDKPDSAFAAYLTCSSNSQIEFQYAAAFMAYRYCHEALLAMDISSAQAAADKLSRQENDQLQADMEYYAESFAAQSDADYIAAVSREDRNAPMRSSVVDLLVNWHIQQYVLPTQVEEEELFDPMDETQVDLSGLPHYVAYDEDDAA